jgi:hypothetical protein
MHFFYTIFIYKYGFFNFLPPLNKGGKRILAIFVKS